MSFKNYLFYFFLLISALAPEPIRIITSRDLKGNLKSCTCTAIPIAGLAGRGSFFETQKLNPKRDILIELGNFIGPAIPPEKYPAIFEGFLALGYHALGISEFEFKNISESGWEKFIFQPVSTNVNSKSSGDAIFKTLETFYRNGNTIHYLSLHLPSSQSKIGEVYLKSYNYTPVNQKLLQLASEYKGDLWILSFYGNFSELEEVNIPEKMNNRLIILNPFLSEKDEFRTTKKLGKIFFQNGENGDEVNIFEFGETLKFIKKNRIVLDAEKLKEHEKISGIIKKYNLN